MFCNWINAFLLLHLDSAQAGQLCVEDFVRIYIGLDLIHTHHFPGQFP